MALGRELFDFAFREYSRRWMFKRPTPADFFRTMEDASGIDLDWFWRGWFYTTHANDQAIASVTVQDAQELVGDTEQGRYYYRVQVDNEGGLVMPLEIEATFEDGTTLRFDLPVDVWRNNELTFTKGFFTDQEVVEVVVDPDESFADIDRSNNTWRRAVS